MADTRLTLQDKTAISFGPINTVVQSLATVLTENGADVALIDKNAVKYQRFAENLMEMRQIHPSYGRTAIIENPNMDSKTPKDILSRVPELFGGIDIFIDAQLMEIYEFEKGNADHMLRFESVKNVSSAALDFLKSRQRGRIIYLFHEIIKKSGEPNNSYQFFHEYIRTISLQMVNSRISVNGIAVGITEEYLLKQFPQQKSIQLSLKHVQESIPHAKIVNGVEVAQAVTFLASNLSQGISGQVLRVNHALL